MLTWNLGCEQCLGCETAFKPSKRQKYHVSFHFYSDSARLSNYSTLGFKAQLHRLSFGTLSYWKVCFIARNV